MDNMVLRLLAMLFCAASLGGCKKETPQKTEAPQAPAPQTTPAPAGGAQAKTGEAVFNQYCVACHANGGNTINTQKPLNGKALAANGITKPEDIVRLMRNPGPGMTKFDQATIPDKDATAVAEYVLKTFK